MDSDQPIHATNVDYECWSLAWRPNGKQTDDEGVDAARKSADNFILVWWVYQRTGVFLSRKKNESSGWRAWRQEAMHFHAQTFFRIPNFAYCLGPFGIEGKDGVPLWILSQHSNLVFWLSFSPDGRFLASADTSRKLIIWATEVNKKTERIKREWL